MLDAEPANTEREMCAFNDTGMFGVQQGGSKPNGIANANPELRMQ